jgi:hypothetical protein
MSRSVRWSVFRAMAAVAVATVVATGMVGEAQAAAGAKDEQELVLEPQQQAVLHTNRLVPTSVCIEFEDPKPGETGQLSLAAVDGSHRALLVSSYENPKNCLDHKWRGTDVRVTNIGSTKLDVYAS